MSALVLDSPEYQLSLQQNLLHIQHPEQDVRLLPIQSLERLILGLGITLSTDLQLKLLELGTEVILIGKQSCAYLFNPKQAPNSLRLWQYKVIMDETSRAILVKKLLSARRQGQNRVLSMLNQTRLPALKFSLKHSMLAEAELSHQYWRAWSRVFAQDQFNGRQRQPPTDPINALLSLTSTLEDQALLQPFLAEGFDLTLGFHHTTGYYRSSLILDVKELTRAELEAWIIQHWQAGTLRAEHFDKGRVACRLTREGQQIFYRQWFAWQKTRKVKLRRLAKICRRLLEREYKRAQTALDD